MTARRRRRSSQTNGEWLLSLEQYHTKMSCIDSKVNRSLLKSTLRLIICFSRPLQPKHSASRRRLGLNYCVTIDSQQTFQYQIRSNDTFQRPNLRLETLCLDFVGFLFVNTNTQKDQMAQTNYKSRGNFFFSTWNDPRSGRQVLLPCSFCQTMIVWGKNDFFQSFGTNSS